MRIGRNIYKGMGGDSVGKAAMRSNSKSGVRSAEKISMTVLYYLVGIVAVSFLAFFLIGYNMPAMWNESINSPLFTDLIIALAFIFLVAAVVLSVVSRLHSFKVGHQEDVVNGIPVKRIARGVAFGVVVLMLAFCFLWPVADEIFINGSAYDDRLWMHVANMFVNTSLMLIVVGVAVICIATVINRRRR